METNRMKFWGHPQVWNLEGDIAWIMLRGRRVLGDFAFTNFPGEAHP